MASLALFTASLAAGAQAQGQESRQAPQVLTYDVYASGFHVVEARLHIRFPEKDTYFISLDAHTRGFLGSIVPWEGRFETHGWDTDGRFHPRLHKSTATWKDETDIKEYNYTREGGFRDLVITEHGKEPKQKDLEAEIVADTTDTLSMALNVMRRVASGETCDKSEDVFDGKRRFAQIFKFEKEEQLSRSRYNIYEGPAQRCVVEVQPISGEWHEKPRGWMSIQEQGRERGTMPTVWIAEIAEDIPAVPVKILVRTAYGALVMHLTSYVSGETELTAEKRKN